MGVDAFVRNVLRKMHPRAFYPRQSGLKKDKQMIWPDRRGLKGAADDLNSRVRSFPLCMTSDSYTLPHGLKTWGQLTNRLGDEYLKQFAEGIDTIAAIWDGKTPRAKESEQRMRYSDHLRSQEKHMNHDERYKPYQWPEVKSLDDPGYRADKSWFQEEDMPQCGFNEIYYFKPAKIKFYEFITEYLLRRMPLPVGKTIIVDCGVMDGVILSRPIQATMVLMPDGSHERRVSDVPNTTPYDTYTEADDRLAYWVYYFSPNLDCEVTSEDGDTLQTLLATCRSRREATPPGKKTNRLYWKRRQRVATLADHSNVSQVEIIDVNDLSDFIETLFGGLLLQGSKGNSSAYTDPVLFVSMLVLMRKNDYSEGFSGLTMVNVFRAVEAHPELCRKMLRCEPAPTDHPVTDPRAHYAAPVTVRIHAQTFRQFVHAGFAEGYKKRERLVPATPRKSKSQTLEGSDDEDASDVDDLEADFDEKGKRKNGGGKKGSPEPKQARIAKKGVIMLDGKPMRILKRADIYPSTYPIPSDDTIDAVGARIAWTLAKTANGGRPCYQIANEFLLAKASNLPVHGYQLQDMEVIDPHTGERSTRKGAVFAPKVDKRELLGVYHRQ